MLSGRLKATLAAAGVLAAGALLPAQAAQAAAGDSVECINSYVTGPTPGYITRCHLYPTTSASQQIWTFNTIHFAPGDGKSTITPACGRKGATYEVQVSYLDGAGVSNALTVYGTCGAPNP